MRSSVTGTRLHCEYCGGNIEWDEAVVESRIMSIVDGDPHVVQVVHRHCWIVMDTVVKTILKSAKDMLTDGVDKTFPTV